MQQIEIRIGNCTRIDFSLPGQLARQIHQRLTPERSGARIGPYFPEGARISEVNLGRRRVEIVSLQGVLEVPADLQLDALADREIFLRRALRPSQRSASHDV